MKRSILEGLVRVGCQVQVVPWDTPAADVLAQAPDGVFVSNGPGDPDAVVGTYEQVRQLLGEVPVFGICLGLQMICKAAGVRMEKMKFGHHGGNQPVANLLTGRVEITAQNHGFNLVYPSLGPLDAGRAWAWTGMCAMRRRKSGAVCARAAHGGVFAPSHRAWRRICAIRRPAAPLDKLYLAHAVELVSEQV